jgi:hypothetical protein
MQAIDGFAARRQLEQFDCGFTESDNFVSGRDFFGEFSGELYMLYWI